jgi:glycoside/pentoside/hexuronide:cation symporter, GPH family
MSIKRGVKKGYAAYSLPAFILAFAGLPLYVVAPDFYATEMGVSLGLIALLLLGIRAFDAIQDPLIGYLSDKFSHMRDVAFGIAFLLFALGMLVLYIPVPFFAPYAFVTGAVFVATAFSIISINLNAIGSLITQDTHEKTDVTSWREGFGVLGLLIAVLLPVVLEKLLDPRTAFAVYALIFGIAVIIVSAIFMPWLKKQSYLFERDKKNATISVFNAFSFLKTFRIRFFYLIYMVSIFASALPAVLVLFFIRDVLGAEDTAGLFLLVYFLAGIFAIPIWRILARHIGKERAWAASMLLAVAAFIWAGFLGVGDTLAYTAICVISGVALGAELILPPSILSDIIDESETGTVTSSHFSFLAFLMKLAMAIAAVMSFSLLDQAGFKAAEKNASGALCMLSILYAFIPCGLKLSSAGMLFWYCNDQQNGKIKNEKDYSLDGDGGKYHA